MFLIAGITMDGQQHNKDSSHYQMETRTSMESDHDRSLVNDVLTRLGFGGVGNKGKDDCSVNEDKDTPDQASTENHNQKITAKESIEGIINPQDEPTLPKQDYLRSTRSIHMPSTIRRGSKRLAAKEKKNVHKDSQMKGHVSNAIERRVTRKMIAHSQSNLSATLKKDDLSSVDSTVLSLKERKRIAAKKCRDRRKQYFLDVFQECKDLVKQNATLQEKVAELETRKKSYEDIYRIFVASSLQNQVPSIQSIDEKKNRTLQEKDAEFESKKKSYDDVVRSFVVSSDLAFKRKRGACSINNNVKSSKAKKKRYGVNSNSADTTLKAFIVNAPHMKPTYPTGAIGVQNELCMAGDTASDNQPVQNSSIDAIMDQNKNLRQENNTETDLKIISNQLKKDNADHIQIQSHDDPIVLHEGSSVTNELPGYLTTTSGSMQLKTHGSILSNRVDMTSPSRIAYSTQVQKKLEYQISGVKGNTEDSFSKTPDQKVFGSAGEMNKDMTQCVTKKEGNLAKETDHEIEKHERANMLRDCRQLSKEYTVACNKADEEMGNTPAISVNAVKMSRSFNHDTDHEDSMMVVGGLKGNEANWLNEKLPYGRTYVPRIQNGPFPTSNVTGEMIQSSIPPEDILPVISPEKLQNQKNSISAQVGSINKQNSLASPPSRERNKSKIDTVSKAQSLVLLLGEVLAEAMLSRQTNNRVDTEHIPLSKSGGLTEHASKNQPHSSEINVENSEMSKNDEISYNLETAYDSILDIPDPGIPDPGVKDLDSSISPNISVTDIQQSNIQDWNYLDVD